MKPFFSKDASVNNEQRQLQKSNKDENYNKDKKEEEQDKTYSERKQDQYKLDRNHINNLPDEIVQIIRLFTGKSSEQTLNTCDSLVKSCFRFTSVVEKERAEILPRIHFEFLEKAPQEFSTSL